MPEPRRNLENSQSTYPARLCPLRDLTSPEYRLLMSTIREEIAKAFEHNGDALRNLRYNRAQLILMAGAIVAAVVKWH